jgi:hypothetical protein
MLALTAEHISAPYDCDLFSLIPSAQAKLIDSIRKSVTSLMNWLVHHQTALVYRSYVLSHRNNRRGAAPDAQSPSSNEVCNIVAFVNSLGLLFDEVICMELPSVEEKPPRMHPYVHINGFICRSAKRLSFDCNESSDDVRGRDVASNHHRSSNCSVIKAIERTSDRLLEAKENFLLMFFCQIVLQLDLLLSTKRSVFIKMATLLLTLYIQPSTTTITATTT